MWDWSKFSDNEEVSNLIFVLHEGGFWIGRLGDGWEWCGHKKAVAFGTFSLVWNLSSVVARIWALFLLFVAFRYYYQINLQQQLSTQNPDYDYEQPPKLNIIHIQKPNKTNTAT